jgi:RNA polymerase sigma factor (sigma-70 family)
MANGLLHGVLHYLRGCVELQAAGHESDGKLLERFTTRRDQEAFAALLLRHGPLVWGVCRRLLRNVADAEDAFQATFLVLVRQAASVRKRESVSSWLYGVAYRVARRAQLARSRQQGREHALCHEPPAVAEQEVVEREMRAVLDDELQRLPEKYRAPVLLCDLEGKTLDEAAQLLRCPRATVATRLVRARRRLRDRLVRRGWALPATALAATLAGGAAEAAPPALLSATTRACTLQAAGDLAGLAVLFPRAVALVKGVLPTMSLTRITLAALVCVAIGVAVAGANSWFTQPPTEAPVATASLRAPAPASLVHPLERQAGDQPAPASPGKLAFAAKKDKFIEIFVINADGTQARVLTSSEGFCLDPAWSPDGKKILFRQGTEGAYESNLVVMDADGRNPKLLTRGGADFNPAWSPDGSMILFNTNYAQGTVIRVMDADGGNIKQVSKKDALHPAWSPDGKKIAFSSSAGRLAIHVMDADGSNVVALTPNSGGNDMYPAWSPDGKRIAFCSDRAGDGPQLYVMDADGGNVKKLTAGGGQHRATNPAWSPDGKQIAYSDNGPVDREIFVVNADGSGHKQLTRLEGQNLQVSWSPDGKQLAFLHAVGGKSVANSTGVYVMDANGGNLRQLHKDATYLPVRLSWKPK